jgi:hypothetical protein
MIFGNMCINGSLVEHRIAGRAAVLHRFHMRLLHVSLQIENPTNRFPANETDKAVVARLNLSPHQQLQLFIGATGAAG